MNTIEIAVRALIRPGPNTVTTAIARISDGKASITSMMRMMTLSTQPPRKPAMAPEMVPTITASDTVTSPTISESRVP